MPFPLRFVLLLQDKGLFTLHISLMAIWLGQDNQTTAAIAQVSEKQNGREYHMKKH